VSAKVDYTRKILELSSTDPTLPLCSAEVDLQDGLSHFGDGDAFAGTLEERALLRALDDGDPGSIEVLVVPSFVRELTFQTRSTTPGAPAESYSFDRPRAGLRTSHTDTLYAAALAGMGITGLPSFVAEEALLENALERVLPCWHLLSTTIYAAMPTRKHVPARTRAFIDFLVETFGGEDRDPWLLAAGCETQPTEPVAKGGRKRAAPVPA
jgi:hypothetical protein